MTDDDVAEAEEDTALSEIEAVLTDVAGSPITPAKVRWLGRELDLLLPGLDPLAPGQREGLGELLDDVLGRFVEAMKTATPTLAATIALTQRRLDALGQKLGLPA